MRISDWFIVLATPFLASAAAINNDNSLAARGTAQQCLILTQLMEDITMHTAIINKTVDNNVIISPTIQDPTPQNLAAKATIREQITQIQSLFATASNQLNATRLSPGNEKCDSEWAAEKCESIVFELGSTYKMVSDKLGFKYGYESFAPLIPSLKLVLISVESAWTNAFWLFESWFLAKRVILGSFLHVFLGM